MYWNYCAFFSLKVVLFKMKLKMVEVLKIFDVKFYFFLLYIIIVGSLFFISLMFIFDNSIFINLRFAWFFSKILIIFFIFISVLQECTTDSEELIYPVRAASSCSAPPDLLLTSEREQFSVRNPHLINKNADSTIKTPKSVKSEQERVRLEVITCCSFIYIFFFFSFKIFSL